MPRRRSTNAELVPYLQQSPFDAFVDANMSKVEDPYYAAKIYNLFADNFVPNQLPMVTKEFLYLEACILYSQIDRQFISDSRRFSAISRCLKKCIEENREYVLIQAEFLHKSGRYPLVCGVLNQLIGPNCTPPIIGRQPTVGTPPIIGYQPTVGTPPIIGCQPTVGTPPIIGRQLTVGTPPIIGRQLTLGTPIGISVHQASIYSSNIVFYSIGQQQHQANSARNDRNMTDRYLSAAISGNPAIQPNSVASEHNNTTKSALWNAFMR